MKFLSCYLVPHLSLTPVALRASLHLVISESQMKQVRIDHSLFSCAMGGDQHAVSAAKPQYSVPMGRLVKAYDPTRGCDLWSDGTYGWLLMSCNLSLKKVSNEIWNHAGAEDVMMSCNLLNAEKAEKCD